MIKPFFVTAILLSSVPAFAASFDCETAEHPEEKAICGDRELSQLDSNIGLTYFYLITECSALTASRKIRESQRDWLMQTRSQFKSKATDAAKLKANLELRSNFLNSVLVDCGRKNGTRIASSGPIAIDMRSGRPIDIEELFTDLGADQLDKVLRKALRKTAEAFIENNIAKEYQDDYEYRSCLDDYLDTEYQHFERWLVRVVKTGDLAFGMPTCSSRQTHEDLNVPETIFSAKDLKPYLNAYGRSLLLGEGQVLAPIRPAGKCSDSNWAKLPFQPAQVSSGEGYALLLNGDGKLWAWGRNDSGQLGSGEEDILRDKLVLVGEDYVTASASQSTSAAIRTDGSLWTWGSNGLRKLDGVETKAQQRLVKIGNNFVDVKLDYSKAIALQRDGSLWLWDRSKIEEPLLPKQIASDVKQFKFGPRGKIIALKKDGSLVTSAGFSNSNPNPDDWQTIGSGFANLGSGGGDDLAFKTDDSVWVWGDFPYFFVYSNDHHDLSTGISIGRGFTKVSSLPDSNFVAALKRDGSLWGTRYRSQGRQIEPQSCNFIDVEVIDFPSVGNGNDVATVGVRSNGELVMWRNWNMDARWTSDRRMFSAAPHVLGNSFVKLYRIDPKWGDAHVRLFAQKGDGSIWELVNSSETQGKYVPTMKKVFGI